MCGVCTGSSTKKTRLYSPARSILSPSHAMSPLAFGMMQSEQAGLVQSQHASSGEHAGWRQQELGVICPESTAPVIAESSSRTWTGR